jgi:peroxiredoxin Q/BCP
MLEEGDQAPEIELPDETGERVSLKDLRGRTIVLYFYPKDDTEGCTLEAKEFSERMKSFARAGATVIGISPDSPRSHEKFKCKHELSVRLASDADKTVVNAYGVWVEKSMYGRTFMGVERATFLVGPEGRIVRIWRKVSAKGHAEEVLQAVRAAATAKPTKGARR